MIPKVEIEYNPFCQAASLIIDGSVFDRPGSKINSSLVGKPMCDWLQPRISSYQQWDGFLAELMSEINDERFELTFCGLADDYAIFCAEISCQTTNVKELGFSTSLYRCRFQEKYAPNQIVSQLKNFLKRCPASSLPTQELYIIRDAINETLNQATSLSIEEARVIVEDFRNYLSKLCNEFKSSKEQHQEFREMLHQLYDLY